MSDCCLQCQCDLCLNGHTTPLTGPPPERKPRSDVRTLRGMNKRAAELRAEARAIQNAGQQYKRRAERRAARFYDAANRIDGLGRLRDTRGGRARLESFDLEAASLERRAAS
jgi:hypothetical protein